MRPAAAPRTIDCMLRLAPSHPPLWRTPSTLQFGVDAIVRVDDVTPWQERVIESLHDGIPDAMLIPLAEGFGASRDEAVRFSQTLRPALTPPAGADIVAAVELPPDLAYEETVTLIDALRTAGVRLDEVRTWSHASTGQPVIVVAHRLLDPRRAARLVADDTWHVPIELSGDRVTVGPLVIPGSTACLACLHAHRRDADAQWPLLAAQLVGRPPSATDRALLLEAALLATQLLRRRGSEESTSVEVSSGSGQRVWHAHRPHPECLCRSPERTSIAAVRDVRSLPTTTAREYARPA